MVQRKAKRKKLQKIRRLTEQRDALRMQVKGLLAESIKANWRKGDCILSEHEANSMCNAAVYLMEVSYMHTLLVSGVCEVVCVCLCVFVCARK